MSDTALIHALLVWLLPAMIAGIVVWSSYKIGKASTGVRLFANRAALQRATQPLHRAEAAEIEAALLLGRRLLRSGRLHVKVSKLMLPDPSSTSLSNAEKYSGHWSLGADIKNSTLAALDQGIDVKWYPEWTGFSWWIADRGSLDAFVHIELVLPESEPDDRPRYESTGTETSCYLLH